MSYTHEVSKIAQQMIQAADRPTRIKAAIDTINKLNVGAEITDDAHGTMIYIPKA